MKQMTPLMQTSPSDVNLRISEFTCRQQSEALQHSVDVSPAGERGVVQQLREWRKQGGGEEGLPAGGDRETHK